MPNTSHNPFTYWPCVGVLASCWALVSCSLPTPPTATTTATAAQAAATPAAPALCHAPGTSAWHLLGEERWPVDAQYAGVPVGGLSSIDYDAATDSYLLVSDDRSAHDGARFYAATLRYDASGLHQVTLTDRHYLRTQEGQLYPSSASAKGSPAAVPDPEALRLLPGGRSLVWSSEGDFARGFGPELIEARPDGQWLRNWPLPAHLQLPADPAANRGPRNNMTFEGIAISHDQQSLWLSMEGALKQDGPLPRRGNAGGPLRITQYDIAQRQPVRQLAYVPDALPPDALTLPLVAVNGVSEILADGPDHLLVLERSYVLGSGFSVRLYRIATADASNTLAQDVLAPGTFHAASKQLVLDFAQLGLKTVDNIEGMTWGPRLTTGERVLVLVSDNNFNPAEVTQLIAVAETAECRP